MAKHACGPRDECRLPVIALDGPSALTFYRDRDERLQAEKLQGESQHNQRTSPSKLRKSVAASPRKHIPSSDSANTTRNHAESGASGEIFASSGASVEAPVDLTDLEDTWFLSDEDVAAELVASTSVYGRASNHTNAGVEDGADGDIATGDASALGLKRTRRFDITRCASSSADLKRISLAELGVQPPLPGSPLHILAGTARARRTVRHVHERTCTAMTSPDCFKLLGDQILVPAPEFTFLLLAAYLSLPELIQVGMEMCGHYRMSGAMTCRLTRSQGAVYGCNALTTPERIQGFLGTMRGFPGIEKARRAAKYLVADSASPMETILYLLLCLPRSLGGYGLPAPSLNAKRCVNKDARHFTLSRTLIPDLYWAEAHLDVEYDSEEFHASADALARGARRTMALRAMRVDVISMTADMVYDKSAFDGFAHLLGRSLGRRIRRADTRALQRREDLRKALLG